MSSAVYISSEVADIAALYPYLTDVSFRDLTVRDQLAKQAETLRQAHAAGDRRVRMQLQSWWPVASGRSIDALMSVSLSEMDSRLTISREYGFANWAAVEALKTERVDPSFEQALDEMLSGDLMVLQERLARSPELARTRTVFGHRSTLLHYLGANGVESHRQVTPLNAADAARMLIRHGADVTAKADMYGGGQTAYVLAHTSAHPYKAGIADELLDVLSGNAG